MSELIVHIIKASRSPCVISVIFCFAFACAGVAVGLHVYHRQSEAFQNHSQLKFNDSKIETQMQSVPITETPRFSKRPFVLKQCLLKLTVPIGIFKVRTETRLASPVIALPNGEGAVAAYRSKQWRVYKLNKFEHSNQVLYSCTMCTPIKGLILLPGNHLNVVHQNGIIAEISLKNYSVRKFKINDIGYVLNLGSLSSDPQKLPPDKLLLVESYDGHVFSFNKNTKKKQIHAKGLLRPRSVSYYHYAGENLFVVCNSGNHKVIIYDFFWNKMFSIGDYGKKNGQMYYPTVALGLQDGNILVSDTSNNRVSEFLLNGTFVKHLLHITKPTSMSLYGQYLWIKTGKGEFRKYQLYITC